MKISLFLPPAGALVVSALLLSMQNRSIATVDESSDAIATAVASPKSDSAGAAERAFPRRSGRTVYVHEGKPDWAAISERLRVMQESEQGFNPRMRNELESAVKAMTIQQLLAALDEIDALNLPRDRSEEMASMASKELAIKDPAALLTRIADKGRGRFRFDSVRSEALRNWIGKDASSAITWGDGMKQAGRFAVKRLDGKQPVLLQYEALMVKTLRDQGDTAGAERRKAGLPEDIRTDLEGELNKPAER